MTGGTCSTGGSIAGAGSCTIIVQFAPTLATTSTATISLDYNNGAATQSTTRALSGTGLNSAELAFSPSTKDFGSVSVGTNSSAQSFTVTNSGVTATNVFLALSTGTQFAISSNNCGVSGAKITLAAAGTCTFNVTFSPTSSGAKSDTLTITFDDTVVTGQTQTATLAGVGSAPGAFTITSATATGSGQINLSWGSASGAASYTVKYGTSSGSYGTTHSTSATSPTVITGLSVGTPYYFMVVAVNSAGSTDATAEATATPTLTVSTNLLGYWTLDSSSISGATINAVTGHGSAGTSVNSPTQITGSVGNGALTFNGTNQYIGLGNVLNPTTGITLAAWVRSTASRFQGIISKNGNTTSACASDSAQGYHLALNANGTVACWLNRYDGGDIVLGGVTAVNDGLWHFVVCSADGSSSSNNMKIYIDGSLTADATGTIANSSGTMLRTTTDVLVVGSGYRAVSGCGSFSTESSNFEGSLDDIRIYGRGITAAESQTLYNLGLVLSPPWVVRTVDTIFNFSPVGGQAPYVYSVSSGEGSIDSSGAFTAPSTAGTSTIQVSAANGATATATVVTTETTPTIVTSGLVLNLDPTYGTGSSFPGCSATNWSDLIYGLPNTLVNVGIACATTSGWAGAGSPANPYRLALDGVNDYVSLPMVASVFFCPSVRVIELVA